MSPALKKRKNTAKKKQGGKGRPFEKGNKFSKGRPNGSKNKIPGNLREMIFNVLGDLGGEKWLRTLAKADPAEFNKLLAKIIPRDVEVQTESFAEFLDSLPPRKK